MVFKPNYDMKGFTLVELMVVISITTIMSLLILPNFRLSEQQLSVKISAYRLAQDLRRAQEKAMSSIKFNGQISAGGYGINFVLDSNTYILFADVNANGQYDGEGEKVEEIDISSIKITPKYSYLYYPNGGDPIEMWASLSELSVIFVPPDPSVVIDSAETSYNDEYMVSLGYDSEITKSVKINGVGLIFIVD